MSRRVLNYRTEADARRALARLRKRWSNACPGCVVEIVRSPHWLFPFRWLIQVTGTDGRISYWSAAK